MFVQLHDKRPQSSAASVPDSQAFMFSFRWFWLKRLIFVKVKAFIKTCVIYSFFTVWPLTCWSEGSVRHQGNILSSAGKMRNFKDFKQHRILMWTFSRFVSYYSPFCNILCFLSFSLHQSCFLMAAATWWVPPDDIYYEMALNKLNYTELNELNGKT